MVLIRTSGICKHIIRRVAGHKPAAPVFFQGFWTRVSRNICIPCRLDACATTADGPASKLGLLDFLFFLRRSPDDFAKFVYIGDIIDR